MKAEAASFPRRLAFTLVEILVVVAVISALGAVAVVSIRETQEHSRDTKLESDVATVNAALALYELSGGAIPHNPHPTNIVTLLKQEATPESAAANQVASGSFVDLRLRAVMMEGGEVSSTRPRAVFDTNSNRFRIQTSGSTAVREFRLDEVENVAAVARISDRQLAPDGWVWNHDTNAVAAPPPPSGATPTLVAAPRRELQKLAPPVFSPPGGSAPLASFQPTVRVTISHPNPGGLLFYAANGSERAIYTGPVQVSAGGQLSAWVESDDPARWLNSDVSVARYAVLPHVLEVDLDAPTSVNFLQAGGVIPGLPPVQRATARLTLNLDTIHANYLSGNVAEIFVTADGTDPRGLAQGGGVAWTPDLRYEVPILWGNFGANTSMSLGAFAAARSGLFSDSEVATANITISRISLPGPRISPLPEDTYLSTIPPWIELALIAGVHPAGSQIYYTMGRGDLLTADGLPTSAAILYTGGFNPLLVSPTMVTLRAAVVVPQNMRNWFTSQTASAVYRLPGGADNTVVGAIVGSGNIDGTFHGSLILANPTGTINFNSQGRILGGNLFLPGTPEIVIQPHPGTVVARGQNFVPGAAIPRNVIGGKEFTEDGRLANPQSDLRQIVDLLGSHLPSNYLFRFNAQSYLDGKLFRRANPPPFPVVTLPTGLVSRGSIDLRSNSNPPAVTLPGGDYSSVTINANNNVIRLGDPNATEPVRYIFRNANFNHGRIEIIGPTRLYFPNGFNVNHTVVGNLDNPGLLEIRVLQGDVNVNSNGTLATRLVAPSSRVSLNGIFRGTLTAQELRINSNGVAFTLPPIVEGR